MCRFIKWNNKYINLNDVSSLEIVEINDDMFDIVLEKRNELLKYVLSTHKSKDDAKLVMDRYLTYIDIIE